MPMMRCEWQQLSERTWICLRCGKIVGAAYDAQGHLIEPLWDNMPECSGVMRQAPPPQARMMSYAQAIMRWMRAGRPVRSDERVADIYETICRPCPHFDEDRSVCRICGCFVRRDGAAFLNKLRMATESCSADPPRWQPEYPPKKNDGL